MNTEDQIKHALQFRFACKEFDPQRKIPPEQFILILESARLSPSSFGMEPWKFLVVQNAELRQKLAVASWGGAKQLATASHVVVLLARSGADMRYNSGYITQTMAEVQQTPPERIPIRQQRMKNFQEHDYDLTSERALFDWACMQTYIALSSMMNTAALLEIDSCAIEGFDRPRTEEILVHANVLDRAHFGVACMAAFGYRLTPLNKEKTRRSVNEVVRWIE